MRDWEGVESIPVEKRSRRADPHRLAGFRSDRRQGGERNTLMTFGKLRFVSLSAGWCLAVLGFLAGDVVAADSEQWGVWEASLNGPGEGNPYVDVELSCTFRHEGESVTVRGFYDGDGAYKVRFSPPAQGSWRYETRSNRPELNGKGGSFAVGPPSAENHGPVQVFQTFYFRHADGLPYHQLGTTCYAWVHQPRELQEQTLKTLAAAPFNKIRFCVFPKSYYIANKNEPDRFAFEKRADGKFDFSRPDPEFWRLFERRILDLQKLGIEADIILWHPYDRWGFSEMSDKEDDRYLRYCIARLSAYRNVWWSLANEYGFMTDRRPGGHGGNKQWDDWDRAGDRLYKVDAVDPWEMTIKPWGTARAGELSVSAPKPDFAFRFTPYGPGERLRPGARPTASVTEDNHSHLRSLSSQTSATKPRAAIARPRVVILSDFPPLDVIPVGAGHGPAEKRSDPDDVQSMVRFLLYTNDFDVEGLVASAATLANVAKKQNVLDILDLYDRVDENLRRHDPRYPTAERLRAVTWEGRSGTYGKPAGEILGDGKDSEASDAIIRLVDRSDPRPVWFCVWGGSCDLAQAIWKVRATRSAADLERFLGKLRIYLIAKQDGSAQWLLDSFPGLFVILSERNYMGMFWNMHGSEAKLADLAWVKEHIRDGHGALGASYPESGANPRTPGVIEGDSPSFLHLAGAARGRNDPEQPDQAGWGGRFVRRDPSRNHWFDDPAGGETVWRWRAEVQQDFARRADWMRAPER